MAFYWHSRSSDGQHGCSHQATVLVLGLLLFVVPARTQALQPAGRINFDQPMPDAASLASHHSSGGASNGYITTTGNGPAADVPLAQPIDGPFTLSAFIRAEAFPNEGPNGFSDVSPAAIVSLHGDAGTRTFLRVLQGKVQFAVSVDDGWQSTTSLRSLLTGRWVHVAGVYTNGQLMVFINGHLDGRKVLPAEYRHNTYTRLVAGASDDNKRFWRGDLDEVMVFDRALDSAALRKAVGIEISTDLPRVALDDRTSGPFPLKPALRVADDVVHPIVDSGGAHVTFVPWSGPDSLEMISSGHPSLFGSRAALLRVVGEDDSAWRPGDGFPLYDAGQTLPFPGARLVSVLRPDGLFDVVGFGNGAAFGDVYLSWYRNTGHIGEPHFTEAVPVGVAGRALVEAVADEINDASLGDVDGDGTPDLIVVTREPLKEYMPDGESFWSRREHPNAGPGRGYDVAGNWLGNRMNAKVYWAPGYWSADDAISFGELRPVYLGNDSFQVQLKTYGFFTSTGAIEFDGRPYLLIFGDVDCVFALPTRRDGDDLRCGPAVPLLADNARLRATFFSSQFAFADLDRDGKTEIVLCGNSGRPTVLKGDRPGEFREIGTLNRRGGYVEVDTLAVPCRTDWDGDGPEDLIVGDASGRLWFWPGTDDPTVYGEPAYFRVGGEPFRRIAGHSGSLQGPSEYGWGYLQPTVGDWDGDGSTVIITNDIRGELMLYRAQSPGSLDLVAAPITHNDKPLPSAWRTRPAIVNRGGSPALLYMDDEGDLAIATPIALGETDMAGSEKLHDQDGRPLHLCGPAGHFGRIKFAATDWDGDNHWDILFGTARMNYAYFMPKNELPAGASPGILRNLGGDGLAFARPVLLRDRAGESIDLGHHICAVWPTQLDGDDRLDLIAGSEDGKVYYTLRSDIKNMQCISESSKIKE